MSIRRTSLLSTLLLGLAVPLAGQSLEEVLAKHHEAIGGVDAWKAVESMHSVGYLSLMGGMAEGSIEVAQKRPASLRADLVIQGMDVVQAYDGEIGWMVNPFAGSSDPTEMDPITMEAMTEQSDLDGPLVGAEEEGISLALLGTETVSGGEAYAIEVTFTTGQKSTYFLDATTYLTVRVEGDRPGVGKTTTTLGDYREVEGLMMAFSTNSVSPQGDQAVAWDTIEINVELDDSMFSMPGDN